VTAAALILDLVTLWGLVGALVALVFLTIGIDRIDEDARGAFVFRLLIVPGVIVLWPLVLWRWWVLETGRDRWPLRHAPPRRAHGVAALALAIVVPITFFGALAIRQHWPAEVAPERLAPPPEAGQ
jgi:hypothetical protein